VTESLKNVTLISLVSSTVAATVAPRLSLHLSTGDTDSL